ncbi:DUF2007 domain-containing protein [Photobacterium nomapromontoriensis]|uniref:putative signal transducing protein n=1 Tax=Photobacterium nomapromontoriensis TaxID=2910237 RepID=UPI003D1154E9
MIEPWCKVYGAANSLEAHSLKGMLESDNIEVMLRGEGLGAAAGELPTNVMEVEIWVRQSQLRLARQLLDHYELADSPTWSCRRCGEDNDGAFELCWQCGQERP